MTRCMAKRVFSIATLAAALILASFAARSEDAKPAAPDRSLIENGEYLARVGDCVACHTAPEANSLLAAWPCRRRSGRYSPPTSRRIARPGSAMDR